MKILQKPIGANVRNLAGLKFARLTVVEYVGIDEKYGQAAWLCRCECGAEKIVKGTLLTNDDIKSCGCWKREEFLQRITKHGETSRSLRPPEYSAWINMRARCSRENHPNYHQYGGRGVKVCERWDSYAAFLADVGPRPSKLHSIHRLDNDLGYYPDNVKWSLSEIQQNARRNNHRLSFNGKIQTIAQWATEIGIDAHTLFCRVDRGWTTERALTTPLIKKGTA